MRVLVVNTLYPPGRVGGAERSVQLLARGLARAGHDVAVACVADTSTATVDRDGEIEVHRFPLRNRHWPFDVTVERSASERLRWHVRDMHNRTATDDLLAVVAEFRPDVINTNNLTGFSTEVWRGARARELPVVHTLRDYSLACSRATLFRKGRDCERRCAPCWALTQRKRHNSSLVDHVVGISDAVLRRHREVGYFVDTPSDVVHNIAAGDVPATPQELDGDVVFGFLGRVEVEKGIEVLLEASAMLDDSGHRVHVGGVGAPDYVERLRRDHPDAAIDWLGQVDADEFFAAIDTLVVPAIWAEPMGRTVIEAAIRGVSVIHSDAGGIPEVATMSAQRRQVTAADAPSLAAALADVVAHPAAWRRRRPATASALEPFSSDHVIGRHVDVFEQVIAASG